MSLPIASEKGEEGPRNPIPREERKYTRPDPSYPESEGGTLPTGSRNQSTSEPLPTGDRKPFPGRLGSPSYPESEENNTTNNTINNTINSKTKSKDDKDENPSVGNQQSVGNQHTSMLETNEGVCRNPTKGYVGNQRRSITKELPEVLPVELPVTNNAKKTKSPKEKPQATKRMEAYDRIILKSDGRTYRDLTLGEDDGTIEMWNRQVENIYGGIVVKTESAFGLEHKTSLLELIQRGWSKEDFDRLYERALNKRELDDRLGFWNPAAG